MDGDKRDKKWGCLLRFIRPLQTKDFGVNYENINRKKSIALKDHDSLILESGLK